MPLRIRLSLVAVGIIFLSSPGRLTGLPSAQREMAHSGAACGRSDSAAVVRVATRFHLILSTGDTTGINGLLAPDLRVLEGGTVENRQEYLAHHLAADIEFTKAVKEERTSSSYRCDGNVAWLV